MKRLAVALLFLGLLAGPLAVQAQPAGTRPRIGFLATAPSDSDLDETRQALRELGWVDGQNITIEVRWTGGRIERIRHLVAELVGLKVDVIYAEGSVAAARAAKEATTTIPIVVTSPADLVRGRPLPTDQPFRCRMRFWRRTGDYRLLPRAPGALQGTAECDLRAAAENLRPARFRNSRCASARRFLSEVPQEKSGAAVAAPDLPSAGYSRQILKTTPVPGIWTSGPSRAPTKCVSAPASLTAP
jgi:hypothetical protein